MPDAPDKAIYDNVITVLTATGYFSSVLGGFVSPSDFGNARPVAMVLKGGTAIELDKGVSGDARDLSFKVVYFDRAAASEDVNHLLDDARETIIGRNNGGDFDGGLMKDPTRGGSAQWTIPGRELRGPDVFLDVLGFSVGLHPPEGVGLLNFTCRYFVNHGA